MGWGGGGGMEREGEGAIKAERVCCLVLLGASTCPPFQEGILHSWMGGRSSTRWIEGEEGEFKNCERWGRLGNFGRPQTPGLP